MPILTQPEWISRAQASFDQHHPTLLGQFRFAFRKWRDQDRQDKIQEAVAAAWSAWRSLCERGIDPVEVGVYGIANNAVRYVRNGRRVANRHCGRGAMDVFHPRSGFKLYSYDLEDRTTRATWKEWLLAHPSAPVPDLAAMAIDFEVWLAGHSLRNRQILSMLAAGEGVTEIARQVGISPGRVSQMRTGARASWAAYNGQGAA